jgi:hypothetical protein
MCEKKHPYVSLEIAKWLKEIGFNEPCSHYYINDYQSFKSDGILHKTRLPNDLESDNIFQFVKRCKQPHLLNVPNQSIVAEWLMTNHDIYIDVGLSQFSKPHDLKWMYSIVFLKTLTYSHSKSSYKSPSESLSAAIEYIKENDIINKN